jgi:uncharacterized protein YjdB
MSLQKGESESIYYRIEPENATDKVVSVESNNKNVVTVSDISVENETVSLKAVGKGEAIVTFTTHDGSYSADCDVTVTESTTGGGESGGSTGGATSGGGGGCDAGVAGVAGVFAIGLLSAGIAVSKRRG